VMGQVAREHNFGAAPNPHSSLPPQMHSPSGTVGAPLAQLCDPACGLEVGCTVLAAKLAIAHGDTNRALQLWNGGGNPNYATEVLARVIRYN